MTHDHHQHAHPHSQHHDGEHSHARSLFHDHTHIAPVRTPHRAGFSLIALSGLQRLVLVLPVICVLWLTAFWAMRSGG